MLQLKVRVVDVVGLCGAGLWAQGGSLMVNGRLYGLALRKRAAFVFQCED
jgi:hypothetical protein